MEAIVLVGGQGLRLRPIISDRPKPLAPVLGKPFLDHLISYWSQQGVKKFILSCGYQSELIHNFVEQHSLKKQIELVIEELPLGTGGGFLNATSSLSQKAPFLLMNGDTYFPISLKDLIGFQRQHKAKIVISACSMDSEKGRYTTLDFNEQKQLISLDSSSQSPWVNSGVYLIHPDLLSVWSSHHGKKCHFESDLLSSLCLNNNHKAIVKTWEQTSFIDIGTVEDYNRIEQFMTKDV